MAFFVFVADLTGLGRTDIGDAAVTFGQKLIKRKASPLVPKDLIS